MSSSKIQAIPHGQYVNIKAEGIVICRVPIRKDKYFGLTDQERAAEMADLFEENRDRILNGAG